MGINQKNEKSAIKFMVFKITYNMEIICINGIRFIQTIVDFFYKRKFQTTVKYFWIQKC
jgi:hypothetical protein